MSVAVTFVLIPIILLVGFGIPLAIGLYVYRDARRRGMNAALWTLVAILAPSLIGFIIYLLVRNNNSDMLCPRCDTPVREDYVICPNCGAKLQPYCLNCAAPVQPDWKVCPRCTQPLSEFQDDVVVPHRHKDNSLGKILIAVIVIPILLIIVLILSISVFKVSTSSSGGYSSISTEVSWYDLFRAKNGSEVKEWMQSIEAEDDKAYVLEYKSLMHQDPFRYYYVLYVPAAGSGAEMGFGITGGLFKDVMKIEFESDDTVIENSGIQSDNTKLKSVYCIEIAVDRKAKLEVYCNGQKLKCEVTPVDFDPTLGLLEP